MIYKLQKKFEWDFPLSKFAAKAMRMFGYSKQRYVRHRPAYEARLDVLPGDVVYISGCSGAGKSVLLRELWRKVPRNQRLNIDRVRLPRDKMVVECFGDIGFVNTMIYLSSVGLADVHTLFNAPALLSDGQKWRFRLAQALASKKQWIFADEFCANLDTVTAGIVSHHIRKWADRDKKIFVLASSRRDLFAELQPDMIVHKEFGNPAKTQYKYEARQREFEVAS